MTKSIKVEDDLVQNLILLPAKDTLTNVASSLFQLESGIKSEIVIIRETTERMEQEIDNQILGLKKLKSFLILQASQRSAALQNMIGRN